MTCNALIFSGRFVVCCTLAWCGLVTCAAAAQTPTHIQTFLPLILNQGDAVVEDAPEPMGLSDPSLNAWYKGIGTCVTVIILFFISWYLIYPGALRRGGVWPVTLFGYCTCGAWATSWLIVLYLYWDELRFAPPPDGAQPFEREWGLRGACLGLALLLGVLSLVYWRSDTRSQVAS